MPIRWKFSVYSAVSSTGAAGWGCARTVELWMRYCESQSISWCQHKGEESSQAAAPALTRLWGQAGLAEEGVFPGGMLCSHSSVPAPVPARDGCPAAQPQLPAWHSQACTALISTGKHPCPSLKASHTDIGIWFRWLNEKMSKSLPGFLHSNQLSKI